jgi:hypothetical protein
VTDLIATVLPDEDTPPPALIINDGFFPEVDPAMFREQHRIRDAVTPARAREALIAAMLTVYRDLAGLRCSTAQQAPCGWPTSASPMGPCR